MGGTKGSGTGTSAWGAGQGGYGQRGQNMSNPLSGINAMMMLMSPEYAKKFGPQNTMFNGMGVQERPAAMTMPTMPEYANYQQMPSYINNEPAAPSQAITDFMSSSYASGGSIRNKSLDEDIQAALRIVRLLGELKKT